MTKTCEWCGGGKPPKEIVKGHGIKCGHCNTYAKIVAPRASKKPMQSKKK